MNNMLRYVTRRRACDGVLFPREASKKVSSPVAGYSLACQLSACGDGKTCKRSKLMACRRNSLPVLHRHRLALYNVAFERGLFPKDSFKETMQYGMSQHKLKGDCAESRRILHMLEKGVMDAIKKKYAKTITFYITDAASGPGDEENVLEEYVFRVQYGTRDGAVALDGITASLGGQTKATSAGRVTGARRLDDEEYIKRAAKDMVKSLIALMRTLEPVPDKRKVSMKLTYVDDTVRSSGTPPSVLLRPSSPAFPRRLSLALCALLIPPCNSSTLPLLSPAGRLPASLLRGV